MINFNNQKTFRRLVTYFIDNQYIDIEGTTIITLIL